MEGKQFRTGVRHEVFDGDDVVAPEDPTHLVAALELPEPEGPADVLSNLTLLSGRIARERAFASRSDEEAINSPRSSDSSGNSRA